MLIAALIAGFIGGLFACALVWNHMIRLERDLLPSNVTAPSVRVSESSAAEEV